MAPLRLIEAFAAEFVFVRTLCAAFGRHIERMSRPPTKLFYEGDALGPDDTALAAPRQIIRAV